MNVAQLSPAEHTRALQKAIQWCHRHGILAVDDLLGGGTDLQADTILWEDFLSSLKLSSVVLSNRHGGSPRAARSARR